MIWRLSPSRTLGCGTRAASEVRQNYLVHNETGCSGSATGRWTSGVDCEAEGLLLVRTGTVGDPPLD
ncbi:hypothetical protein MLD38_005910 [Melastoma candidum]|uniref:Uncharacterized protein n=1 Tax=Melastoma candidum TaxID=119954 RepID=A0ACB9RKM5_9MYRT|nr:hypothetical protein MLD38_005910 [Melastoma candidum]